MKLKFFSVIPLIGIAASTALLTNEITKNHTQTNLINTSNHDLSVDTTTNYDEKWNASIKESSENNNIKLFFSRYATLSYQQSFLVAEYMLLDNLYNFSGNGSTTDDIVFFYGDQYYQDKTYWNVWDWESKYVNDNARLKMVNTTQKLDSSFENNVYGNYPDSNLISDVLTYYEKQDPNFTFDLWVVDAALWSFWEEYRISNLYDFIKHIDKIYVLTDGNWQTYYFMEYCSTRYRTVDYTQLSESEIESLFQNYKADTTDSQKEDFENRKLYDFLIDPNIFTFFHTREYTDSPYWFSDSYKYKIPTGINLFNTYSINWNYYDFASKNIPTSTTAGTENPQEIFINDYESIFNITNKTILDFFIENINNYDPTKKNVIWLGDSLVLDSSYIYPEKTNEMQSILQSWLKSFPSSEYNFIFKSHPSFNLEKQREYIQWLLDSPDDSNFIYFDTVPWEVFLSWNYKMEQTDSNYSGFFSKTANIPNANFVGFQFTSTTLQTTAFFLKDSYNYSLDQVESTLNPYYFPLPETFDVVNRTTSFSISPADQLQINKDKIAQIYQPFVQNGTYPDYTRDSIPATDFIRDVYNPQYSINSNISNLDTPSGLSQSAKIAIGVVVPVVAIAACVATTLIVKKKKGKKL